MTADRSRGRILAIVPSQAQHTNMAVNQRLRALASWGELGIFSCYPDAFPDDIRRVADVTGAPMLSRLPPGTIRLCAFTVATLLWSLGQRMLGREWSLIYCFQDTSAVAGLVLHGPNTGWVVDALDDPALELGNAREQRKTMKASALAFRDYLFKALVRRADLVVTIGRDIGDPLPQLLVSEYGVSPNRIVAVVQAIENGKQPVADESTVRPSSGGVQRLFYVGWVSPLRGVDTLIRATRLLHARGVSLELRLAGQLKGQDRAWMASAERLDPGLVRYLGALPAEVVRREITQASVCICPFLDRRELRPVQPVKILEYLAAGKPVVASRLPGISAVIEDGVCGVLVDPEDSGQLADAIGKVLEDPDFARGLGEAGRRRVRQFDLAVVNRMLGEAVGRWI